MVTGRPGLASLSSNRWTRILRIAPKRARSFTGTEAGEPMLGMLWNATRRHVEGDAGLANSRPRERPRANGRGRDSSPGHHPSPPPLSPGGAADGLASTYRTCSSTTR